MQNLEVLLEKGKRLIVIESLQEAEYLRTLRDISQHSRRLYYTWSSTRGLHQIPASFDKKPMSNKVEYLFSEILDTERPSVFILLDFHPFIADHLNIRRIKDVLNTSEHSSIVLLSPEIEIPEELKFYATNYELPIPSKEEIKKVVYDYAKNWSREHGKKVKRKGESVLDRLIDNLSGLPFADMDRLAKNAIYNDGIIDKQDIIDVAKEKFKLLNQDSVLHLHLDFESMHNVAGLDNLKQWLERRKPVFSGDVVLPGEDIPKGALLLGVQGCGKSLAAKAIAACWQVPLLHLDVGSLYNRFFGQTEENLRDALQTTEAMEPCILWLDEIEKGLSAVSSNDDVSRRMLGTFLTWMAEKSTRVFVVATSNDVSALPPELLRKGRFDEVFFVDLPTEDERQKILEIHLSKREIGLEQQEIHEIAKETQGFSGAELEQLVVSSLYAGHSKDTSVDVNLLQTEAAATQPLSVLMAEEVEYLREWASQRAVKA